MSIFDDTPDIEDDRLPLARDAIRAILAHSPARIVQVRNTVQEIQRRVNKKGQVTDEQLKTLEYILGQLEGQHGQ